LADPVEGALSEQPAILSNVQSCYVVRAGQVKEEGAELFVAANEIAPPEKRRTVRILLRPVSLLDAEALRILLHSEDRWLQVAAVYELGERCILDLWEDLRNMACEHDPVLLETHKWTVERLSLESSM
jgi:hypothetical protein